MAFVLIARARARPSFAATLSLYLLPPESGLVHALAIEHIFRRFFGVPGAPGGQGDPVQRSLGSGVLVDPAGLIVTNNHVIEGADQVKVSLADKREFEADMVLKDSRSDLAVLRIRAQNE